MYISDSKFMILSSLDSMGVIKRDMETESMVVSSIGNEYKIILERRSRTLFSDVSSTAYKCSMKIQNMFGNDIVTLLGDEVEISKFIDVLYFFLESKEPNTMFQFGSYEGSCYIALSREFDSTYKPFYNMVLLRMDYSEHMVPIATLKFDDETMSSYLDAMYFTFLIDIEQFEPNAHIYRYIDHDMWLADHREELGLEDK